MFSAKKQRHSVLVYSKYGLLFLFINYSRGIMYKPTSMKRLKNG